MIELNETLPESLKNDMPPDSLPKEPMTKPSERPLTPELERFIQNAIDRFKDQTTPFPEVW
jgi:hypothetical protein